MAKSKKTPMMRQWAEIKQSVPDGIVLFRLGDFYEAFHEDAETLARVCDVTLTSRPVKKGERVPMAGVPYHAVDGYIAQLVRAGVKVAIVEQRGPETSPEKRSRMSPVPPPEDAPRSDPDALLEPSGVKRKPSRSSILEREIVRVVTPGTLVEGELLEPGANNFLAALVETGEGAGLAALDLSTGEFLTTAFQGPDAGRRARDEIARLRPAELVLPQPAGDAEEARLEALRAQLEHLALPTVLAPSPAWRFDPETAERALLDQLGGRSLAPYGCQDEPLAIAAAGGVLAYVTEQQRGAPEQVTTLRTWRDGGYMRLDAVTRRNLELSRSLRGETKGSLLHVLDRSRSPMGGRRLRAWLDQPLLAREAIEARLDAVQALLEAPIERSSLREGLKGLPDLERLTNRVVSGYAGPRELLRLAAGLRALAPLAAELGAERAAEAWPARLAELEALAAPEVADCAARVEAALDEEPPAQMGVAGVIRAGHDEALDAIHASVRGARDWIASLEARERERTGIQKIKVGYNKVFGYYLGVPKSQAGRVPEDWIRKQTLVDSERYVTPELKERESEVLHAEERILARERELYAALVAELRAAAPSLLAAARDAGRLDAFCALAEVAAEGGYRRPALDDSRALDIREGRHPVVEALRSDLPFVPNDLVLGEGEIAILTGPNMAGKSTVGRQAALIVLLAQIGSFVPAASARIGLVDRIFTRIGAQDELAAGQSTFMVEMVETAAILNQAGPRSLLILDELGRGTSTYDGIAIAWAVVEHVHDAPGLGARTIFATHYHELTALAEHLPRVRNLCMAVTEGPEGVVFLHRVDEGTADRSYGVHVAELAGLPRDVTRRAWEILRRLEAEGQAPLQAGARPPGAGEGQLSFLAPSGGEHPLLARLRALEPERMTPLEALALLDELRREAREEGA